MYQTIFNPWVSDFSASSQRGGEADGDGGGGLNLTLLKRKLSGLKLTLFTGNRDPIETILSMPETYLRD